MGDETEAIGGTGEIGRWEAVAPAAMATLGGLTAHRLAVQARVTQPVSLHTHQGAALRGAWFGALRGRFCVRQELTSCQPCTLHAVCPISALVATVDDESPRGADVARPFALEPPASNRLTYQRGSIYRFGMTLFGQAIQHLPYTLVGLQELGSARFGLAGPEGAGRLDLERVEAWNSITGRRLPVYAGAGSGASGGGSGGGGLVRQPGVPVTHADVLARAARWLGQDRITLRLRTPLRLGKEPVRRVEPGFFLRRLVDRMEALALRYSAGRAGIRPLGAQGAASLGAQAAGVRVLDERTRWVEVQSYSSRQGRRTPLSGLVGQITFGADPERLAVFLPWLVWGEIAHAGKDATRGNGWYELVSPTPDLAVRAQW